MKVIYIADDGTQFENQLDCEDYEWELNHPFLKNIVMFDKDGNNLKDLFSQESYEKTCKIIIPGEETLKQFKEFVEYTGYCSYEMIDQVGIWEWDEKDLYFKRKGGRDE